MPRGMPAVYLTGTFYACWVRMAAASRSSRGPRSYHAYCRNCPTLVPRATAGIWRDRARRLRSDRRNDRCRCGGYPLRFRRFGDTRRIGVAGRSAYRKAQELGADLIHDHTDTVPPRGFSIPIVRTIHGPATSAAVTRYHTLSRRGDSFIAISHRQKELFIAAAQEQYGPGNNIRFAGVVHNPLNIDAAPFYPKSEKRGYVAFLGRCHWEKSPDGAIRVAQAAGVPLMMALRVTTEERAYFEAVVQPLYRSIKNLAKFVGEVSGAEKDELIGRAGAVIFPSPWEEPFGLVLAEAGARGTPVVALARGSAPELVIDGVTGILCADEEAMVRAIPAAMHLDPAVCRAHAMKLFDRDMIARQHVTLYET